MDKTSRQAGKYLQQQITTAASLPKKMKGKKSEGEKQESDLHEKEIRCRIVCAQCMLKQYFIGI